MKKKNLFLPLLIVVLIVVLGVGIAGAAVYLGGAGGTEEVNLQKGLIAHWKMDGNAKDSTSYGNDGTVSGATLTTDRKGGTNKAYSFDGSTSVITVPNFGTKIPTNEITVAVWVKPGVGSTAEDDLIGFDPFESPSDNRFNIHFPWNPNIYWQFGNPIQGQGCSVALDSSWTGVWGHYVFTYSYAVNSSKIFRNGVQVASGNANNPYTPYAATLRIGGRAAYPFQGEMDDLRIYNRALSQTEVTALYNEYDSGIVISDLQKGLVGHWKMDGNAKDATPYRNHGIVTGASLATDRKGQVNKAYSFDGNDKINAGNSSIFNLTTALTLSSWVNLRSKPVNEYPSIIRKNINPYADPWEMYSLTVSENSSTMLFEIATGSGTQASLPAPAEISLNEWHHVVGTYDGAMMRMYIDGVNVVSQALTGSITTQTSNLIIGATGSDTVVSHYLDGSLDDVRVYNRALSQTEITALYEEYDPGIVISDLQKGLVGQWKVDGNANDSTPYRNHGTVSGATLTTDRKGELNRAYSFNGSAYIDVGGNASLNIKTPITLAAWVYPTTTSANQAIISSRFQSSPDNTQYELRVESGTAVQYWFIDAGDNSYHAVIRKTGVLTLSAWNHIVVTNDGTNLNLYVNGVNQYSGTTAYTPKTGYAKTAIGDAVANDFFTGYIDDARIYNRALSAAEVQALYESY